MSDARTVKPGELREWLVTYETAVMSRWKTENGAWVAHDRAVMQGLNPDALAVVETAAKCGGCRQPATRRDAFDVADVCDFCGEASDESLRLMNERDARDAAREAHGDYLRDEGKDRHR